jgi:hypothetical protein
MTRPTTQGEWLQARPRVYIRDTAAERERQRREQRFDRVCAAFGLVAFLYFVGRCAVAWWL